MTDIEPSGRSKLERCCDTCAFFDRDGSDRWSKGDWPGECHRRPPDHKQGWPEVYDGDWCGEYEPADRSVNVSAETSVHPGAHNPPEVSRGEVFSALQTLLRAADAGILPAAAYADLARLRVSVTLAFPPPAAPCEPQF